MTDRRIDISFSIVWIKSDDEDDDANAAKGEDWVIKAKQLFFLKWLMMIVAECKWVQLTVDFEVPWGGGERQNLSRVEQAAGWPWNIHAPGDSFHKESKLSQ